MPRTAIPEKTWCRACGGGGDFLDGDHVNTCGVCGGTGEHDVDHGPYGVIGDGLEAYYEPPAPDVRHDVPADDEPLTQQLHLLDLRPPVPFVPPVRRHRSRLRRYGWLWGLLAAGIAMQLRELIGSLSGPQIAVLVAVAWVLLSLPCAVLIDRALRDADRRR